MQATSWTQGGHWHGQQQAYAPQSYAAPQPYRDVPQSYAPHWQSQAPQSQSPQSYAPQSHASQSPESHEHEPPRQHHFDEHGGCNDDEDAVARWFAEVDRMVLQYGEEIVCPKVFANSFESDDAFKVWCLGMPSVVRTMITTKPGCWNRFKILFSKWFLTDVSPSIDDFISELIEFDEQKLELQEQPDESIEFEKQKLEQQEYPGIVVNDSEHPRVLDENQAVATTSMTTVDTRTVEKSLRLDWRDLVRPASPRTSHGTAVGTTPPGTIGSHLYHPRYGEARYGRITRPVRGKIITDRDSISRATVQSSGRDAARGSGGGTDREADRAPIVDGTAGEPRGDGVAGKRRSETD
jgi:hypothetical protein